jgi:hypothetical protein
MLVLALMVSVWVQPGIDHPVSTVGELRQAVSRAKAGDRILLKPGDYPGGTHLSGLSGLPGKPIVIASEEPAKPARFVGGGNAIQLSASSWVTLRNLVATGQSGNGFNVDDGGNLKTSSKGVVLDGLVVTDLPAGNHDGIKLSGLTDFAVTNCRIEKWGGSGVDMVGCARGIIQNCTFRNGGDSGVQAKGGTKDVSVARCKFDNFGQRGVNIGGSTGLPYFRPPIDQVPPGKRFEAQNISVQGCTFIGGMAPIAFVGVDGATVQFNTIYHPGRWAIRILQETRSPDFVPSRNGVFRDNLVVFRTDQWSSGGVNIGPGTQPESFKFDRNLWFCSDRPAASRASLPAREVGGIAGVDPQFIDPAKGDFRVRKGSPAEQIGAHAFKG